MPDNNLLIANANIGRISASITQSEETITRLEQEANDTISSIESLSSGYTSYQKGILNSCTWPSEVDGEYTDGEIFVFNDIKYTYDSRYNAFVCQYEGLSTKNNFTNFMVPDFVLERLGANVITEFNIDKSLKHSRTDYFRKKGQKISEISDISETNELPITRIFNVDNGKNKIYFEFEQYWTLGNVSITSKEQNINGGSSCMLFSLFNSLPFSAQEKYNNQAILSEINQRFDYIFKGANNNPTSLQNMSRAKQLFAAINSNYNGQDYLYDWSLIDTRSLRDNPKDVIDPNSSYVIRLIPHDRNNPFKGTPSQGEKGTYTNGPHNVSAIPDGNGGFYILDSNHALNRPLNEANYIPHLSLIDLPSLIPNSTYAAEINYNTTTLSARAAN